MRLGGLFKLQKNICHFSRKEFMKKEFRAGDFPAPFFNQSSVIQAEVEAQANQVQHTTWTCQDTEGFWLEVHNFQNALGQHPYRTLSQGVLKLLCLPVSNAEVERVFSQVNVVKDKKRNAMKTELLDAILYIKFGLRRLENTSQNFVPPNSVCNFTNSIYG